MRLPHWFLSLLFLIGLTFLLSACRKMKVDYYPTKEFQVYNSQFLAHFKNYRLFSVNGEINDVALINAYATEFNQFFYTSSSKLSDPAYQSFSMVNEDSMLNGGIVPLPELKRKSTGTYDIFLSGRRVPVNDTNALFLHIGEYKLHEMASVGNYRYVELEYPANVVKKVQDTLFFPIMRYITIRRKDNVVAFVSDMLNNVFLPAGTDKLKPYDTLLVQQFDLGLRRTK